MKKRIAQGLMAVAACLVLPCYAELSPLRVAGRDLVADGKPVRLRGINWGWWHLSATRYTEDDMRRQAEWGANVARLAFSYGDLEDKAHPGTWREDGFGQLDEAVRWAKKYNQYVILDMHVVPGGQSPAAYTDGGGNRVWKDGACQTRYVNLWCEIARRYRNRPEVAAYELMNEPVTQRPTPELLTNLGNRAIAAIREIDPGKVIVMPGDQWSNARDLTDAVKVSDTNVLYTFHFYEGGPPEGWLRNVNEGRGAVIASPDVSEWQRFDIPVKIDTGVNALSVLLRSSKNSGAAWFDEIALTDGKGNVVQSNTFDKDAQPYRMEHEPQTDGAYDAAVGHDKPGSLRVSGTAAYNGFISPRWSVSPGQTYHLTGWIKLQKATGETFIGAALFGVTGSRVDRGDLRKRLLPAVAFAKKYDVPLWVGEFGCARNSGPEGLQVNSIASRIELFEEFGFSWSYWNYHETTHPESMALQAQKRNGEEFPLNEALLAVLKDGWLLNKAPLKAGERFRHTHPAAAGIPDGYFPFVLLWDDAEAGTATDVSFLNAKPAGVNGRIAVRDGQFVESKTGTRVRFVGVNGPAFCEHAEADKLAAHFAKAGVNLVRLHNMDNKGNWGIKGTLFDHGYADTQHYNPTNLDNFDYVVSQFKKHGIYVTFEVQVNRQLKVGDGIADNTLLGKPMKRYDRFSPRWIELQKKWASDLLTRKNPYTGLALGEDPVLATVEINNENSLYQNVYGLPSLEDAPEPYRTELRALWNQWLRKRYGKDEPLLAAWSEGAGLGASVLPSEPVWAPESDSETKVTLTAAGGNAQFAVDAPKDATPWHGQAHVTGLTLQHGKVYTLSFRMKSDTPKSANVRVCHELPNWENYGVARDFAVTTDWQPYAFTFTAYQPVANHARISFILGGGRARFALEDLRLQEGYPPVRLPDGQALVSGTLDVGWGTPPRNRDWRLFMADLDRAYAAEMRGYLVNALKIAAPIIDTQIDYGRLEGLYREESMDYADAHGYWQHPSFPGKLWDFNRWLIENTPEVRALRPDPAKGGANASLLQQLALRRVASKPYVISEFDHPAPSDYAVEMLPTTATFAAQQDWDGFDLFALGNTGPYDYARIGGLFEQLGHPGKWGFLPQAALIFRTGMLPALSDSATLKVPKDIWLDDNLKFEDVWKLGAADGQLPDMMRTRLKIAQGFSAPADKPQIELKRGAERPPAMALLSVDAADVYTAAGESCAVIVGPVQWKRVAAGALTLDKTQTDGGFVAASLVAVDLKPVGQSARLLLTLGGRFSNKGMHWNAEHTSVGSAWGKGPSLAAGLRSQIEVAAAGPRKVFALSGTGQRKEELPATFADGKVRFEAHPKYQTIWYEVCQ